MKIYRLTKDQNGIAALVITILLLTLIGMITLAITEVNVVASKNNLDNELSTQATYAAESGVNDAVEALKNNPSTPIPTSTSCDGTGSFIDLFNLNNVISTSPKISYPCLLVTANPTTLLINVQAGASTVVRVSPSPASKSITITWPSFTSESGGYSLTNCNQANLEFSYQAAWDCPFSVLRMDYYQYNASDTSEKALANDTEAFFFFPTDDGNSSPVPITFDNAGQPTVVPVDCTDGTDPPSCSVTLNAPAYFDGYARLTSIYGPAGNVTISNIGYHTFSGSQLSIDSTGDDQGVLKRIQVRIPLTTASVPPNLIPNNAVSAVQSICKQYYVEPGKSAYPSLSQPALLAPEWIAPLCGEVYKPAIYLYPLHSEDVNVKLSYPYGFATTIPKYNSTTGWNVLAEPNGQLINLSDNKPYPYLYWEGNEMNFNDLDMTKGFLIPGNETSTFLSQELPKIGLNQKETAAFMQYWVPRMENNKFSLIHFVGKSYTDVAKLDITPKPDSLLRVFMAEEPMSHPISVQPQTFPVFHRTGFTAVEWGGTILGQDQGY